MTLVRVPCLFGQVEHAAEPLHDAPALTVATLGRPWRPPASGTVDLDERTRESIAAYDQNPRAYQEALRRRRPIRDIRRFAALAGPGARVLDVGCGPASDLRNLMDVGLHPVGVDLSMGALLEARLLLPRLALVRAPFDRLPFRPGSFGGLWLSAAFVHLPRGLWRETFARLMEVLDRGPVHFSCVRGMADLAPVDDPVLGRVYRSDATEDEVEALLTSHGLRDVQIELRPDPFLDRKRMWVVGLGRTAAG
ncbi:MAG TPA: class I SAM-dependent methyltransferase [Nitriliruptorales bacterium]|nr:class I SAM-dependent methyltransferase [Nitriliruptorales bacterium]